MQSYQRTWTRSTGPAWNKDTEFASLRSSLDAEMKRLRAKGLGYALKQAKPLTLDEEEILWENKILLPNYFWV